MPSEYNPAADETAIATPAATPAAAPATTSSQFGEGYDKALNSERGLRKQLEQRNKAIEAELAENKRALEQAQMTLEQKYQADLEATRNSFQSQVDAAIAERDAKLQAEAEARLGAEQRAAVLEQQSAIAAIQTGFTQTFDGLLVNPRKVQAYMAEIADDLVVDANGQPALIARRDEAGRPVELAPVTSAIAYFQGIYPEDFKPPAEQKTGGGYRNLAASTNGLPSRQGQQPLKLSIAEINANPKAYLENRDRIFAGDFEAK